MIDYLYVALLMGMIPIVVNHYMSNASFSKRAKNISITVGILFVISGAGLNKFVFSWLGLQSGSDDGFHIGMGNDIADAIRLGLWDYIWNYVTFGNHLFHVWIGIVSFFTGAGIESMSALNGFMGFWANMMLARYFSTALPRAQKLPDWSILVFLFPSSFFWTTFLYKEALMYWGICLFFTSTVPVSINGRIKLTPLSAIGFSVAMLMRPYSMITWAAGMSFAFTIISRRFVLAVIGVVMMIAALSFVSTQLKVEDMQEAQEFAEQWGSRYQEQKESGQEGYRSNIEGPQIFFVTGAISLFCRPFFWKPRNFRVVLNIIEIWLVTGFIFYGWLKLNKTEKMSLLLQPNIIISVVVCLMYCALMSFLLNEGQVSRMRIQAMPAMLTLLWLPQAIRLTKKSAQASKRVRNLGKTRLVPHGFDSPVIPNTHAASARATESGH